MEMFLLAFFVTTLVYCLLLAIKSDNAVRNHTKILNAIDAYVFETGEYKKTLVLLEHMESFERTLFRIWDWGYENILPKEDFEWIKPYIN